MVTMRGAGVKGLALLLLANTLLLIFFFHTVEYKTSRHYEEKVAAVNTALMAQKIVGPWLEGEEYTPITTTLGSAEVKRLAMHPDFAAVVVDLLCEAGVQGGDTVAVNMSASFPALNIAVLSAIKAVDANPVIVSSVGASTWGANRPDYTWLDMEITLVENGLWPWRSEAASFGGIGDSGGDLTPEGIALMQEAIKRSGVRFLGAACVEEAIARRLDIYQQYDGRLPSVLINVGGNHVIFGAQGHKAHLGQGLLFGYQAYLAASDGLASKFLTANRPVIHLLNISRLAAQYGIKPSTEPGTSGVFVQRKSAVSLRILMIIWVLAMAVLLGYYKRRNCWQGPCR